MSSVQYTIVENRQSNLLKGFTQTKSAKVHEKYATISLKLPIEIIPINKFNLRGNPYATSQPFFHNFYYFNLNLNFECVCLVCMEYRLQALTKMRCK